MPLLLLLLRFGSIHYCFFSFFWPDWTYLLRCSWPNPFWLYVS